MQVVFLAAGLGSRMLDLVTDAPKALLPVRGGRSILDLNSELLAFHRDAEIVIVGGYRFDIIKAFVAVHPFRDRLRTVHNPQFDRRGPLTSVALGLREASLRSDHVLIANGDTLYDACMFSTAKETPPGIHLLVSRGQVEPEDMEVTVSAGLVAQATKRQAHADDGLISAGLVSVRGAASITDFEDAINVLLEREREGHSLSWHSVFRALHDRGRGASPVQMPRDAWYEFDTPDCIGRYNASTGQGS